MTLRRLSRFLIEGHSESILSPDWLANRERLQGYQDFTDNQLHSCIVKDVAATNRERFWARQAEKRLAKALAFPKAVKRA